MMIFTDPFLYFMFRCYGDLNCDVTVEQEGGTATQSRSNNGEFELILVTMHRGSIINMAFVKDLV